VKKRNLPGLVNTMEIKRYVRNKARYIEGREAASER
jgi:hypothetical protein